MTKRKYAVILSLMLGLSMVATGCGNNTENSTSASSEEESELSQKVVRKKQSL